MYYKERTPPPNRSLDFTTYKSRPTPKRITPYFAFGGSELHTFEHVYLTSDQKCRRFTDLK